MLTGEGGRPEGAVLVLDDVTPLIRAQRVAAWRDVARRLAHEIKNPLTPIQLSAERLRRHFAGAPHPTQALVAECTDAIIVEVEALKGLVDEFAQFARLRGPRMVPADLNRVVDETLGLYGGVLQRGRVIVTRELSANLPPVRLDAEQMRQVIINLVDNALEALGGPGAPPRPNGQPADRHHRDLARRAATASSGWSSPTTGPASRRPIVTSCSCRITRRRGGAAASASRSSGGSSSSTAAASRSPRRSRPARRSPWNLPAA